MLIAIEGLDAAGKNTQAKLLAERVDRVGNVGVIYSFPRYDTSVGQTIRRLLTEELAVMLNGNGRESYVSADANNLVLQCAMLADKYDAAPVIREALRRGHTVICDRWIPSCLAFGAADGLPVDWLSRIHEQLPQPDLNIFLDIPAVEAFKRRPQARDRYEKDRDKQAVVRANYERLWKEKASASPVNGRWVTVSGLGTPDEVHARVWAEIVALAPRIR